MKGADRSFSLYPYKFPVRSRHVYGDGYGAPRNGHVHQGQDILAPCGKRLVAARGGRVQYRGYQASGAGYYLVVDGKATGHDYVYMHLRRGGRPRQGQRVRTGQRIGTVGRDRGRLGLPSPLRDVDQARLVRGRRGDAIRDPAPQVLGPLELARPRGRCR